MCMISATGRIPVAAAPVAKPTMAASEMGVFRTRSGPNRSRRPCVAPYAPPDPTSSPRQNTRSSRSIASLSASAIALEKLIFTRPTPRR